MVKVRRPAFQTSGGQEQALVLKSTRVVSGGEVRELAVVSEGGRIVGLESPRGLSDGPEVIDLGDLVLMPGIVDSHAHLNEPGRAEWEGFVTASRAAAAGGITTVVDMPLNSIPPTTCIAAFAAKQQAARGRVHVDLAFWGGVVPGNAGELEALLDAGARGFKCFLVPSGVDEFPHVSRADLERAMPILGRRGVPLLVHAELEGDAEPAATGDPRRYSTYLASRPASWEVRAMQLMIELGATHRCPVHVVHLSAAAALPAVARARAEGVPLSVETCPHYLTLRAEDIPDGRTEFKCAPPIRDDDNRAALWRGLADGVIDLVVSDHSPCTPELKKKESGDFAQAWGGIASLQFGLPLVWGEARGRGFSLPDIARWMSAAPARLAGLPEKGDIAVGKDADLVAFDPEQPFTIEPHVIHHRHPVTPYLGKTLTGRVMLTVLRGQVVYQAGKHVGVPRGELLLRPRAPLGGSHG
jgi:allantoinase